MIKSTSAKALIIRINLVFLAFFLILYVILLLCPSASDYHQQAALLVRCSFRDCHHKMENGGIKMKAVLEEPNEPKPRRELIKREKPSFLSGIGTRMRIGMVNMDDEDVSEWKAHGQVVPIPFERVSNMFEWKALFPEWIDEEEEYSGSLCPEIPMPDLDKYEKMDLIVAKLPCRAPEEGWNRDVFRLQVHLLVANMAVRMGRWEWGGRMKVVFLSQCMPMVELFRCNELAGKEGEWWYYRPEMSRLEQKVTMPIGSCNLALPLWDDKVHYGGPISSMTANPMGNQPSVRCIQDPIHHPKSKPAKARSLRHGSPLLRILRLRCNNPSHSLLQTRTRRDLIPPRHSISEPARQALSRAGWTLRFIKRIRNPRAEKGSYNEYNYSKFRLWQLTDYDKVIFIDSDVVVFRNLDILFHFPQMSATGNDGSIFNSGVMVIEPSNCTFRMLMNRRKEIVSYNGGDQGFLNEVFVWWQRLPRRVNFLKNFWSNSSIEASVKTSCSGRTLRSCTRCIIWG
ncbi:UNVERIFIED_CONTAM: UDP-glucuronate:xylan alpha-glucuronosyltransferase 2 [Sesamum radiatum]|uniref:Hexosyltransferase n=1 Tax=Sesamum radiatum TaxID=300843 RepID=A0AAW2M4Y4_SESRA